MCSCDDCCRCVPYGARENLKAGCICFAILAAVVVFAVLLAAYGFIRHASVTVEDASLTRFALQTSPATALSYNLSLKLVVRNPNWAMSMKSTKPLEAAYRFDGQQFNRARIGEEGEKLGAGKTVVHRLVLNDAAALDNAGVTEYRKEKATGVFEVEVVVTGEVRYTARYTKCKMEATCPLKLQLAPEGTAAVVFEKVKCKLAKADKNC